jgi:hypothetical protein
VREYDEKIEWYLLDGLEILKAAPADLASKRAAIADLEDALARHEEAGAPIEVRNAEELLKHGDLEEWEREENLKVTRDYRQARIAEWRLLNERLRAERLTLSEMEADLTGVETRAEVYRMRKFPHREFLAITGQHESVDLDAGERQTDRAGQNDALLLAAMVGEVTPDGVRPIRSLDGEDAPDQQVVHILQQRMWLRNGMTPGMAKFFRGGGGSPR